jgi:hypothetical protein
MLYQLHEMVYFTSRFPLPWGSEIINMRATMENMLLTANATLPAYDRNRLIPRIVHLGFGAFHRAHQAVYADILATEHGSDWGYTEVNLIGGEQQIADLQQQDLLYTVAEMSADAWTARVVGVVKGDACPGRWSGKRAGKNVRASGRYCIIDHYRKRLLPLAGQR